MNMPGIHNAMNALAASAVCLEEGVELKYISQALANFSGIGRRFQVYEQLKLSNGTNTSTNSAINFTMIDDYGHHPNEVLTIINALRAGWPGRRVVMLYQPHRFTRTRDLFNDFVSVLAQVDVLILLPVYAASELPIAGASSKDLYKAILNKDFEHGYYFDSYNELYNNLAIIIKSEDIVVVQGAGDISQVAEKLLTDCALN